MTLEQRQRAARAFWADEEAVDDQVQAALLIAQQKKFRPKTVISLDIDRKARHLASLGSLPDQIAARALIVYHLAEQRADDGRVSRRARHRARERFDSRRKASRPTRRRWRQPSRKSRQQFPADDVRLYLKTLLCQDPETWAGLQEPAQKI